MLNKTEHLLTILGEECAEVAQRASKAVRFGLKDIDPERKESATRLLEKELADLMAVANMLGLHIRPEDMQAKVEKVEKYMGYSRQVGALEQEVAE